MISGDNLFLKIIVFWNIVLALVEEDGFPFKVFGCPVTEVPFKVSWSFTQKEHDGSSSISIQVISIGKLLLEFNVDQINE